MSTHNDVSDDFDTRGNDDVSYLTQQLTSSIVEYVEISDQLEVMQKQRKILMTRQKELSTKTTSLMNSLDIDEVNCGTKHKIMKIEKKSTTSLNLKNIEKIISTTNMQTDMKDKMVSDIKNTRVTTLKQGIKLKKL